MQIFLEEDEDDKGYFGDDAAGEIELGCTLAHLVEQLTGAELNTQLHSISLHCRLLLYNALRWFAVHFPTSKTPSQCILLRYTSPSCTLYCTQFVPYHSLALSGFDMLQSKKQTSVV